ncbi:iron-containing alcohol dehydrogenase [uncultured Victivallis sp.]|uniref:iron-containing alcohol dehydrogenase n=1 Tax=uncultured Victivallis sp. TaxID=354118 RepID=UPI0025E9FDC5|nr:iron-containing alcohol dehydrogenase [uncultured Victivallis sp.]
MKPFVNHIPTKLYFGAGQLGMLGTLPMPGKRALVVITSGKSMRSSGTLDRVVKLLEHNHVSAVVYDKVQANPTREQVMEGAALAKQEQCDFVIGLGGGSPIDASKAIAIMAANPGDYWDYVSGGSGKALPIPNPALPIIAITTTAGTGTEADPWSVVTNGNEKIGFGGEMTFPKISIVDPELMLTVPPQLTAFQGFDAFFHAAECFLANCATPISDLYCLKSVELICKSLPRAVRDGEDLAARTDVALANTLSGMAEATSCCTSEHSLAHAIGGFHPNVPHGAALIMISKAWFKFYALRAPKQFAALAKAAGQSDFLGALDKLQRDCGVDELKMSDYGITREELPAINENAWETMGGLFELDRVKMNREESLSILEESYR